MRAGNEDGPGAGVASFTQRRRYPALAEVRGYWEALRAGRLVPCRSEVDPRGIEGALERAFILDRIAPGVARFRLAGMRLNDLMGMEVRGMPLTALLAPRARGEAAAQVEAVFAVPAAVELSLAAETGIGRPALEARMLLLPLRADSGEIGRALGCLADHGALGRAPRRFDLTGATVTPLAGAGAERPARRGFAEAPAAFTAPPRPVPHLRLVRSEG